MQMLAVIFCLVTQVALEAKPAAPQEPVTIIETLRKAYREDAEKYHFHSAKDGGRKLELVPQPIMRWANDDDWSGDVFVWTLAKQPAVIGCMLSGPATAGNRNVFHEFHLLADEPVATAEVQEGRRWSSKSGLTRQPVPDAPPPALSGTGRLTQMRQFSRQFTAHMLAESEWELRSLPQPLFRYGDEQGTIVDGALFAYVWTKGTDPEVILMLECRRTESGLAWYYGPIRFSNRSVWLHYNGKELWRVEGHREPDGKSTDLIYTTAYARTMASPVEDTKPPSALP